MQFIFRLSAAPSRKWPSWLAMVWFLVWPWTLVGLSLVRFFIELPIHLLQHPMAAFASSAARNEHGEFLESYNAYLRRQRWSVVTSLGIFLLIVAETYSVGLGFLRISQPSLVSAYSSSVTLNPTYNTSNLQDLIYTDDGTGSGSCTIGNDLYTCITPADPLNVGGTNVAHSDCSLGDVDVSNFESVLKFSLASIPSNATVTQVQVVINVTRSMSAGVSINHPSSDTPDTLSCNTLDLWDSISNPAATYLTGQSWGTTGVKTYTLGSTANSDVQARLGGTNIYAVGFKANVSNRTAFFNAVQSSTNKPQLIVNYTAPPQTPTSFNHGTVTTTTIPWSWTDNATAETRYDVHDASHNPVTGCTNLAANTASCTETGLSANTQYTRHPNVTDANGNTDGSGASVYTAIESPSGITFGTIASTSIDISATGSFSNLSSGSSGLWFQEGITSTNSGWVTTNSWSKTGLTANTQYSFQTKSRNGDAVENSLTSASTKYTLSTTPNVTSTRSTSTWYATSSFPFTNAAAWGAGGVQYYRYAWDQVSTHSFSGSESTWSNLNANCPGGTCTDAGTTLTKTASADANNWYLHVQAFNTDQVANGSGTDYGPYYFDATNPTAPGSVNDGTGADATYTTSTTTLSANWTVATDATSGLLKYQYAIGTTSGGTQTLAYTDNGTSTAVTNSSLSLASGTTYYISVRAVDNAGNTGSSTTSNGITVDSAPPAAPATVNDGTGADATYTTSTTTLSANWTSVTDPISGLQKYQYAVGTTSGGTQVLSYTDNGTSTTVTNSSLSLSSGTAYYVSVRAVDNAGNTGSSTSSNGITVDSTAPAAPVSVNDGLGADVDYSTSTTTLSANWSSVTDSVSGLAKYQYAIGTTSGGTQTLGYTDNGTTTTVTNSSLSLASGTTYYVSVRAVDNAGNTGTSTTSDGITVDTAAPAAPATVNDGTGADTDTSTSTTTLSANWSTVTDPISGLAKYQYAIGTTVGGTQTLGYTDNGTSTTVTNSSLSLTNGTTYYVSVRAVDNAGNTGSATTSDGITVNTSAPSITDNQLGDTTPRRIAGSTYDVDFTKAPTGPQLDYAQYTIYSGPNKTGTLVKDWTDIFTADTNSYATDWSVDFASLLEGTNYVSVKVVALDALSSELDDVFTVLKDTASPVISSFAATTTTSSATLTWTTNEPATTQIQWGTTTSYGNTTTLDATLTTSHSVSLTGLAANTIYHAQALSSDQAGNSAASSDLAFTTLASPQTLISNVQATVNSSSSVTITWTTNEPATSKVRYGFSTAYGLEVSDATLVTAHSLTLTELAANQTYHYEVISVGSTTDNDADATFATASSTTPSSVETPIITNLGNGSVIADTKPIIAGTGPAGADLFVVVDRQLVRTVLIDAQGKFHVTLVNALSLGTHRLIVRARTQSGLVSDESQPISVTIIRPSPSATIIKTVVTDGSQPSVTYYAVAPAHSSIHVLLDGSMFTTVHAETSQGAYGFILKLAIPKTLTPGQHQFSLFTVDVFGRPSKQVGIVKFMVPVTTATPITTFVRTSQYTVQSGDSLWSIAQRVTGDGNNWKLIQQANLTKFPSLRLHPEILRIGWVLTIPAP